MNIFRKYPYFSYGTLGVALALFLPSCSDNTKFDDGIERAKFQTNQSAVMGTIYYVADYRTGFCYSVGSVGWDSATRSTVDCTDKVLQAIKDDEKFFNKD